MKKHVIYLALATVLFSSCASMVGVNPSQNYRSVTPPVPGQVFIPAGTFDLGAGEDPVVFDQFSQNRKVSVASFFIDANEVTNNEYREFVNWVRDSIAITNFVSNKDQFLVKSKSKVSSTNDLKSIDWKLVTTGKLLWSKSSRKKNPKLDEMFFKQDHLFNKKGDLDTRILNFSYGVFDYNEAYKNRDNLAKTREDFIVRDTINVYPDTTVWIKDFENLGNDLMVKDYFSNPKFGNYPVVGVSWKQAKAYTIWKTEKINREYKGTKRKPIEIRLPTEAEWEYAARGGLEGKNYPWGNELHGPKDCVMANYKLAPGNYVADGGLFTKPSKSYGANNYGLYNMAGNVAEWTENVYSSSPQATAIDLNPRIVSANGSGLQASKRVVKGGSWRDASYFIRNASRTFEDENVARSYIGFRTVMSASLEQSIKK
ncbi:SUMF1/EgtB/PvdO family nonheme iron enzyme [Pedobacter flavus]|uniref:SUMF1/EgtB/PvdO family nonheme iron enzyme n=1 Tax=Pedobacter flavus TaxID=3113906 RepID=A0ABU7H0H1_9SPHI|nr:SUMF1/EgtB/PvdO family nonheme iron enzyme [Pedobacter sp. VNH31]MEE1884825.1 SUMF1/EgtB/PvdO family nonheme iron enzyme [Pedobacter sp. VNH31]